MSFDPKELQSIGSHPLAPLAERADAIVAKIYKVLASKRSEMTFTTLANDTKEIANMAMYLAGEAFVMAGSTATLDALHAHNNKDDKEGGLQ